MHADKRVNREQISTKKEKDPESILMNCVVQRAEKNGIATPEGGIQRPREYGKDLLSMQALISPKAMAVTFASA
jgi:hypothetical protein